MAQREGKREWISPKTFFYPIAMTPEASILTRTELSRPELFALRQSVFVEGKDWVRGDRRRVLWTPAGLTALANHMDVAPAQLADPPPVACKGVVMWANYPNRRLVQVMPEGMRKAVMMKVRDARLYVPGMECELERTERGWMESKRPRTRGRF